MFRTIPGLEQAEFARLGGLHRNTFLNSPKLLDAEFAAEGRSAAALCRTDHRRRGLCRVGGDRADRRALRRGGATRRALSPPPPTTALGALLNHITGGHLSADGEAGARSFQPMNVNFGLFPPIAAPTPQRAKRARAAAKAFDRKRALAERALADLDRWLGPSRLGRGGVARARTSRYAPPACHAPQPVERVDMRRSRAKDRARADPMLQAAR